MISGWGHFDLGRTLRQVLKVQWHLSWVLNGPRGQGSAVGNLREGQLRAEMHSFRVGCACPCQGCRSWYNLNHDENERARESPRQFYASSAGGMVPAGWSAGMRHGQGRRGRHRVSGSLGVDGTLSAAYRRPRRVFGGAVAGPDMRSRAPARGGDRWKVVTSSLGEERGVSLKILRFFVIPSLALDGWSPGARYLRVVVMVCGASGF